MPTQIICPVCRTEWLGDDHRSYHEEVLCNECYELSGFEEKLEHAAANGTNLRLVHNHNNNEYEVHSWDENTITIESDEFITEISHETLQNKFSFIGDEPTY